MTIFTICMPKGRILLREDRLHIIMERLCQQLIEEFGDLANVCIIGIQPRGVLFSDRILQRLAQLQAGVAPSYGKLDITFYRDDFRTRDKPLAASTTEIDFLVEGKQVVLVDDVLYTGRTIQSALSALQHYGRPSRVHLMCLIDRRFNRHLPIAPDFVGHTVDSLDEAFVKVEWKEHDGKDQILLFPEKSRA